MLKECPSTFARTIRKIVSMIINICILSSTQFKYSLPRMIDQPFKDTSFWERGSSMNLFVLHSLSHGCFLYTFYLYRVYIKWRLRTLEHFAALFDKLVALPPGGGGHSLLSAIYLPRKKSNIRFKGTGLIRNRFVQQKLIQKLQ